MLDLKSHDFDKCSDSTPIILVGGGGHCRSVIEAAESSGLIIKGIIDLPDRVGERVGDHPVIGVDPDIPDYVNKYRFIVTVGHIGNCGIRERLCGFIDSVGGRMATIIASTAHLSRHVIIGEGTVVLHSACVNSGAVIGRNCIINTGAIIEHDSLIEDNVHVSTGAIINGGVKIGKGSFIGSGVIVGHGVRIGPGVVLGAGSVTVKDLLTSGVYYGSPARFIRETE